MMKNIFLMVLACLTIAESKAQQINWGSFTNEQRHTATANAGWDYGFVYGLGYGYQVKSKLPVLLTATYSFPSGGNLLDDFKTKIGGQIRLCHVRDFHFGLTVQGIYRKYENPLVRLQNIGSEIAGTAGYYKTNWYVAGEVGFDKAIVTHFKHSASFKEHVYAGVKDGWYQPATGGNFHYGLQAGYSFRKHDITFKIGKVITQDFKTNPLIPYYAQLGYNLKIGKRKKGS